MAAHLPPQNVEQMFAVAAFRMRDPLMHLLAAQYVWCFRQNKHIMMLHLRAAEVMPLPLDLECHLWNLKRDDELAEVNSKAHSLYSRKKLDDLRMEASKLSLATKEAQSEFWSALSVPCPDLATLEALAVKMHAKSDEAELCYSRQLAMGQNSVMLLREYARFLGEVGDDDDGGGGDDDDDDDEINRV